MITDLIFLLPNNGTYTRDSRILRSKLTGPRISPSPPANAPEPQAPSRPPLRSTSHKISPTSGLNQGFHRRNFQLPRHPYIIRPRKQFLRLESGPYLSQRQTLINYDALAEDKQTDLYYSSTSMGRAPVLTAASLTRFPLFAQPFTAALPAAEPYVAGPNFRFQKLTRSCLR